MGAILSVVSHSSWPAVAVLSVASHPIWCTPLMQCRLDRRPRDRARPWRPSADGAWRTPACGRPGTRTREAVSRDGYQQSKRLVRLALIGVRWRRTRSGPGRARPGCCRRPGRRSRRAPRRPGSRSGGRSRPRPGPRRPGRGLQPQPEDRPGDRLRAVERPEHAAAVERLEGGPAEVDADRVVAAAVQHGRRLPEGPDQPGGAGLAVVDLHALALDIQHDLVAGGDHDLVGDVGRLDPPAPAGKAAPAARVKLSRARSPSRNGRRGMQRPPWGSHHGRSVARPWATDPRILRQSDGKSKSVCRRELARADDRDTTSSSETWTRSVDEAGMGLHRLIAQRRLGP